MKRPRARRRDRLLELDEVERRLKPFGRRYLGVRAVPLDALVGTDSRAGAFTRDFRPLHGFSRERLRSLESVFADGGFPPIVTVKLGEAYFVIDGHHRAALARRSGAEMIDADVTELIARVPLPADADMLEVVLQLFDAARNPPAISFQLCFAGTARADPAAETRHLSSASGEPRQQIIQLRELHLKPPLASAGARSEDVQD